MPKPVCHMANAGELMSRVKSEASLDIDGGGAPQARRSRDPRVRSVRAKRELDNNNAQVTARRRAAQRKRHAEYISAEDWFFIAGSALERGARMVRPGVVAWNAAGRCENPYTRTLKGIPHNVWGRVEARENSTRTRFLDVEVPCRRCPPCLFRKRLHWTHRGEAETLAARRTWLVTLTFKPEVRAAMEWKARAAVGDETWRELSLEQRSTKLAAQAQPYVTTWLKRVRSQSGAALRYLSVCELHKDGMPHVHLLVHEVGDMPVRHAVLTGQWSQNGFSNAKLVETGEEHKAADYPAKYLSKNPITRVRASVGYGHGANAS